MSGRQGGWESVGYGHRANVRPGCPDCGGPANTWVTHPGGSFLTAHYDCHDRQRLLTAKELAAYEEANENQGAA